MLENVQPARVKDRLRHGFSRLAEEGLLIRPGEGRRTALLFAHLLLASAVFVMGRTVRDTLFLSRYSLSALPWMFVLYGVASALTVVVYSRVAGKLARDRTIVAWCAIGIATYLATWGVVHSGATWIYPVFYVWSEVFANLAISQFWTLANDLHDARSAKRLFGTIGAARVLGVIVVGLATGAIVRLLGTAQLLFVLMALLVGIALLARRLGREPKASKGSARASSHKHAAQPVARDPYVMALAAMLFAAFASLTIGDYQFKAIARATYKEDDLARFFSFFYAGTGIVSFLFQIFVTPRVLSRFGVGVGLSVMPAVFGTASATLLGLPSLAVATVMKFADNGFQYTIHDTTMQALYVPFMGEVKVRARAFLDAVVKPLAYGLGGLALIVLAKPLGTYLASVSVVLVGVWFVLIPIVRQRYMQKLASTLRAGGLALADGGAVLDAGGKAVLLAALDAPDPRVVLAALDELGGASEREVIDALTKLAAHPDASIRVAALSRLGPHARATDSQADEAAIRSSLVDPVPEVRAAAASAHAMATEDECIDGLLPLLEDDVEDVRSAALAGLLSHGGFEGAMLAGQRLAALLSSDAPRDRVAAAHALGGIGRSGTRRLIMLLGDPDASVRLAAAQAAHTVADARLVPALVERLREAHTRAAAGDALTAIGKASVEPLAVILRDPDEQRAVRLAIPRILRGVHDAHSYAVLRDATQDADSHVRLRVFSALSRLREAMQREPEPFELVRGLVEREVQETLRLRATYDAVRAEVGTYLLDEAVEFSAQRGVRRVLRILELRYEASPIRLVRERIHDPSRRANALEVLDTQIEPAMRSIVMPFLDDVPALDKARRLGIEIDKDGDALLRARLTNKNPYSVLMALDAARVHARPFVDEAAVPLLAHPEPLVREGALLTLAELSPARVPALFPKLTSDSDAQVARMARALLQRAAGATSEATVFSTVEKLLMLRATPMFEKLRGEDLAPLARVAEVDTFEPGDTIFDEGDPGDSLFVVVRGTVVISKGGKELAKMSTNDAFGEMSVLDESPRSARATALDHVQLLRISSEEFYDVLHEQVEIAEGVIRVLSRRLREANAAFEREKHG